LADPFPPATPNSDDTDQSTIRPSASRRRRLPTRRNASPWSRRLVIGVVALVVLAAPLWVDPLTLATFGGSRVSAPPPPASESLDVGAFPGATDDPKLVWTPIAFQNGAIDVGTWRTLSAGILRSASPLDEQSHDAQVVFSFDVPDTAVAPGQVGAMLRGTTDGAAYFASVAFAPGSAPSLVVDAVDGAQLRELAVPVPLSAEATAAGGQLRLRAQVTGIDPATVRVRVWPAATPEPVTWQASVIDWTGVLQRAGTLGVAWTLPAGAATPHFTDFQALSADEGDQIQQ
jgi:hypothetical protein